jgi:hypothetical protein
MLLCGSSGLFTDAFDASVRNGVLGEQSIVKGTEASGRGLI